jgi:hypothetical protein
MARRTLPRIEGQACIKLVGWVFIAFALAANPVVLGRLVSPKGHITSVIRIVAIVLFEGLIAATGFSIVKNSHALWHCLRRRTKQEMALIVGSTLFALIVGDVSLNVAVGSVYKPTKYGWTMSEYKTWWHTVEDQPGHFRTVEQRTFRHGFKRWGDPNTTSTKVLILGDSFTEMKQVSNGEEWYASLERAFPAVEWFVYGQGGYGSLQEYMILNDYIDEIRPDLILWQFCDNDYWNNLYTWDRKTYPHNNFRFRPYLEDGKIVYRLPLDFAPLRKYSKIADIALSFYDANMKHRPRAIRQPTAQEREKAARITQEIFTMAKRRAPDIPVFLLSVSQHTATEATMCTEAGLVCIPGVWEHVERQKAAGLMVEVVNDGHWNSLGNRIVGEYLVQYLQHAPLAQDILTGYRSSVQNRRQSTNPFYRLPHKST